MNKTTLGIIGIVVAVISFFAGFKYDQSKSVSPRAVGSNFEQNGQVRMGGQFGTRGAFNGASGSIVAKDATGITLRLRDDAGSKIVFLSASTTIMMTTSGTANDLIVGKDVTVNGTANPDGSINAQSIQVRPNLVTGTSR
ncbi:MAG: hypothetical protein WAV98_01175 [Minisyncoccia bacterium]